MNFQELEQHMTRLEQELATLKLNIRANPSFGVDSIIDDDKKVINFEHFTYCCYPGLLMLEPSVLIFRHLNYWSVIPMSVHVSHTPEKFQFPSIQI